MDNPSVFDIGDGVLDCPRVLQLGIGFLGFLL